MSEAESRSGGREPAVGRTCGRTRDQERLQQPVPWVRRDFARGRSGRGRQRHADRCAGAAIGDRAAEGAWCNPGKHTQRNSCQKPSFSAFLAAPGVAIGVGATAIYAATQHWQVVIPIEAWAGGFAAALSSASSPEFSRRCAQRGCHPLKRCGACEVCRRPLR